MLTVVVNSGLDPGNTLENLHSDGNELAYHSTQTFVQLPSEILRDCYLIWKPDELLKCCPLKKQKQQHTINSVCNILNKTFYQKPNQNF